MRTHIHAQACKQPHTCLHMNTHVGHTRAACTYRRARTLCYNFFDEPAPVTLSWLRNKKSTCNKGIVNEKKKKKWVEKNEKKETWLQEFCSRDEMLRGEHLERTREIFVLMCKSSCFAAHVHAHTHLYTDACARPDRESPHVTTTLYK